MSDTKISALTAAASALLADEIPINEAGTTKKLTLTQIQTLLASIPAGAGAGTYKASGVLTASVAVAGNGADTTEDTLWTYSLPANTLNTNGQAIRITARLTTAANADIKTTRVYFGATVIATRGAADNNSTYLVTAIVYRTGATAQVAAGYITSNAANPGINPGGAAPAETLSGAVTIKITGQDNSVATANAVVITAVVVEFLA